MNSKLKIVIVGILLLSIMIPTAISIGNDLNNNGIPADAGDLVLMRRASIGEFQADSKYDLNKNGIPADAGDLVLMKRASIGEFQFPEGDVLVGTSWELQSFGPIGKEKKVLPDTKVTMKFTIDDRITGTGGCNNYGASYKIGVDNTISIRDMISTLIFCERFTEQEQQYFDALQNTSTFDVEQNRLQLFYNDGQEVLNFTISKN